MPLEQAQSLLEELDGWRIEDGPKLAKAYKRRDFMGAVDLVNDVARVAEAEGHHPDLYVRWGEVRVYYWTHAVGGLTLNDFIMAARTDQAASAAAGTEPSLR
jgi:4a-hydroxytetrahydrobiopterin dehydratase